MDTLNAEPLRLQRANTPTHELWSVLHDFAERVDVGDWVLIGGQT